MKIAKIISIVLISLSSTLSFAQNKSSDYLHLKWKDVATKMPSEWYASDEAKLVAENILLYQKDIGGWEKNKNFHRLLSESDKEKILQRKPKKGATFDNRATITELRFLAKVYAKLKDERYKQAFEKGLDYIFISQYANGGWPQFYPLKGGYANHITYNDNAMVNTMNCLKDIISDDKKYASMQISDARKAKAQKAFDKGIECILKTQIMVDNQPTVWCAQHDETSFAPAKARSYELKSFSGAESVGITLLLMNIENPSPDVITAVNGAEHWFENNKVEGLKIKREINEEGKKNKMVVEDENASPIWGRFYDLETGKPYFCDRDGIKKNTLAEIGYERRNGYGWYTNAPKKVLVKYPEWLATINNK